MNENFKVAVIIHFYPDTIFEYELIASHQYGKLFSHYPVIAIKPESLVLPEARENAKKHREAVKLVWGFKAKNFWYRHIKPNSNKIVRHEE